MSAPRWILPRLLLSSMLPLLLLLLLGACGEPAPPAAIPVLSADPVGLFGRAEADGGLALRAWLAASRDDLAPPARARVDARLATPARFTLRGAAGREDFLALVDRFAAARAGVLLEELHRAATVALDAVTVPDPRRRRAQAALLLGHVWDGALTRLDEVMPARHRLVSTRPGPGLLGAALGSGPGRAWILVPAGELSRDPDPGSPTGLPAPVRDACAALVALDQVRAVLGSSPVLDELTLEVVVDVSGNGDALEPWFAAARAGLPAGTAPIVLRLDEDPAATPLRSELISVRVVDPVEPVGDRKGLQLVRLESAPGPDDRPAAWARAELKPMQVGAEAAARAVEVLRGRFASFRRDAGPALEVWHEGGRVVVLALGRAPAPGVPPPRDLLVPREDDAVEILSSFLAVLAGDEVHRRTSASGVSPPPFKPPVPPAARLASTGTVPAARFVAWAFSDPNGRRHAAVLLDEAAAAEPPPQWRVTRAREGLITVHATAAPDPATERVRRLFELWAADHVGVARHLVVESRPRARRAVTSPEGRLAWEQATERLGAGRALEPGHVAAGVETEPLDRVRALVGWALRATALDG